MKVWLVVVGRLLPFGWNADEFDLVAIYNNKDAALAHAEAINQPSHQLYEHATVEAWDVWAERAERPSREAAPHVPDVGGESAAIGLVE